MYSQVAVLLLLELDPLSKLCCMGVSMVQGVSRASLIQLSSNVMSCKLSNDNSFSGSIWPSIAEGCASRIICVEMFASCGIAFVIYRISGTRFRNHDFGCYILLDDYCASLVVCCAPDLLDTHTRIPSLRIFCIVCVLQSSGSIVSC